MTPQQAIAIFRAGAVPLDSSQLQIIVAQAREARIEADEGRP